MSIIDTLITDRTGTDLARVQELAAKIKARTATTEEWAEYNQAAMKGAYNYTDLNRVQEAMEYLAERLAGYGYAVGYTPLDVVWTQNSKPTAAQMAQYLSNLKAIKAAFADATTSYPVPVGMEKLTTAGANEIEMLLLAVDAIFPFLEKTFIFSGEAFAGEF